MPKVSNQGLIKWPGGKRNLLPALLAAMPKTFADYHEPFLGGGALMFELLRRDPNQYCVASDANCSLINMYIVCRNDTERLIDRLTEMAQEITEEHFYKVRARFNAHKTGRDKSTNLQHAADFLFLNHLGFNGLYRENSKGEFNVGYCHPGVKSRPHGVAEVVRADVIRAFSELLTNVSLARMPFQESLMYVHDGDFVYLDPPYHPLTPTANFSTYSAGGFGAKEHAELAELAHAAASRGAFVMLSDHDTPEVRALYPDWHVATVQARRSISCSNDSPNHAAEVIITSYPRES